MPTVPLIQIVGGGVFGITTAITFAKRGFDVRILEAGTIPDPLAASTDVSKIVRIEYGTDDTYMDLADRSRDGWLTWNQMADSGQSLFDESGVLILCASPMETGGFEYESYHRLVKKGYGPQRLTREVIAKSFPAWKASEFVDGFFDERCGYARSSATMSWLKQRAVEAGVEVWERARVENIDGGKRPSLTLSSGERFDSDYIVTAAGAWTTILLPEIGGRLRATGHPAFHFRPKNPDLFRCDRFPTFTADMSRTGFFGFPINANGLVKLGHHGPGDLGDPSTDRQVSKTLLDKVRKFIASSLPGLRDADLVYTRQCYYADTVDENFLISWHPSLENVAVAGGGSGHAFKFAPLLGDLVYECLFEDSWSTKFGWERSGSENKREQSRCRTN